MDLPKSTGSRSGWFPVLRSKQHQGLRTGISIMPANCQITKKVSSGFCSERVSGPAFLSCQLVVGSPRRWPPGSPDRRQPASCAFKRHARTSPGALGPWVYFGTEALFLPRIVGQGRIMYEKRHRRPTTAAARRSNCRNIMKGGQM